MPLGIIFATTSDGLFGINGKLPWTCDPDLKFFYNLTKGTNVVMGRKTADSLEKPLSLRNNLVLSTKEYNREGFKSINIEEIGDLENLWQKEDTFIIGGCEILKYFILNYRDQIDFISHTIIGEKYLIKEVKNEVDRIYFDFDLLNYCGDYESFNIGDGVDVNVYNIDNDNFFSNLSKMDSQYLELGKKILAKKSRIGRNGSTRSSFDPEFMITTDFEDGFPVLQSKNVWMKGVVEELDFFWEGKTDTLELEKKGINIWSGNTSKEFIDATGKTWLNPGDMGPMYGYQWRFFGKPWSRLDDPWREPTEGVDQLENLIKGIIKDPYSRRHLLTTYNPEQAELGCLYPCHGITTQFYAEEYGAEGDRGTEGDRGALKISLKTYQRSADWFLGVPFNLSSYSYLLLRIVEELNKRDKNKIYKPGKVTTIFGDAHLYESHIPVFLAQYCFSYFTNKFSSKKVGFDMEKKELTDYHPVKKYIAPMIS